MTSARFVPREFWEMELTGAESMKTKKVLHFGHEATTSRPIYLSKFVLHTDPMVIYFTVGNLQPISHAYSLFVYQTIFLSMCRIKFYGDNPTHHICTGDKPHLPYVYGHTKYISLILGHFYRCLVQVLFFQ